MHYVIVGNGVAGTEAALLLRDRAPDADITVVSEESDHFFSRTALMYVLSGQLCYRDIEPLERDVVARLRLRRVRARATGLDLAKHELSLAGGLTPLRFDRLLIASGSRPRQPPWPGYDLAGVGHMVTLQDLAWLEEEVHGGSGVDKPPNAAAHLAATTPDSPYRQRPSAAKGRGSLTQKPVVVGGGLIGVEAVETLLAAKRRPVFLLKDEFFWPIALDSNEATFIATRLTEHGVDVRTRVDVTALEGDPQGRLAGVRTNQGLIDADLCVIAIGVVPNTDWLGDTLTRDKGGAIVVDEHLATSHPDVFAAGDCAAVVWFDGRRRPEQLWYTSRDQGRVAARVMLGDTVGYRRGTWYNSAKLMDVEYTTAGLVNMAVDGEKSWYFEETGSVRSTTRLVVVGDTVIGFNALGRRWDHSLICRFIEQRRSLSFVLDNLNRARFDTEFVPPLIISTEARSRAPR